VGDNESPCTGAACSRKPVRGCRMEHGKGEIKKEEFIVGKTYFRRKTEVPSTLAGHALKSPD